MRFFYILHSEMRGGLTRWAGHGAAGGVDAEWRLRGALHRTALGDSVRSVLGKSPGLGVGE